jgi:carboxyl-terminal processing protease
MKSTRRIAACFLVPGFFVAACHQPEPEPLSLPEAAFEQVWQDFDRNYAGFANGGRNWDSLRTLYRPQVTASTSTSALFGILGGMLVSLRDGHADIYDDVTGQSASFYSQYVRQKPGNFVGKSLIQSRYLTESNQVNPKILAGRIGTDIGFVRITDFADNASVYAVIDDVMRQYGSLSGFIVDVRHNGGGSETNAQTIASRFTNQTRTYRFAKLRNGTGRGDFADFSPLQLTPAGIVRFTKPVVLLTNRRTFSAAEDFTLMMRALPNVRQLGDTTFGGVFTRPQATKLSYGWTYRVPSAINCDAQKRPIAGGIVPNVALRISVADSLAGNDTILEAAIRLLRP